MVFANRAMQSKAALIREAQNWINESGTIPPGNGAEKALWTDTMRVQDMSPEEFADYEAKKLKMRKVRGQCLRTDLRLVSDLGDLHGCMS